MAENRDLNLYSGPTLRNYFEMTVNFIEEALGDKAFRSQRGVHSAIFDAVMVATSRRLMLDKILSIDAYRNAYSELLEDELFKKYYTSATTDENTIKSRIDIATQKFSLLD